MTEPLDTTHRLTHAIAALTTPAIHVLQRDHTDAREDLDHTHLNHIRYLRRRHDHTPAHARGQWLLAMAVAGQQHRARRAALRPELVTTPSLIDQLHDAVHGTGGTNGARGAGAHRSPIGLAAAELLHDITRTTGTPTTQLATWQPDDLDQAANHAERWLRDAHTILKPARWSEAKAACPICHTRHVWITEHGERIRKAAIQINLSTGEATCIAPSCTGHWPRERLDLLARVLEQDADERGALRHAQRFGHPPHATGA